ncbi:MAG: iron-sulfur cluster assembly scaffold protein [Erythrobacter sp.]
MSKLYTTQLLALSAELASYPFHDRFDRIAEARSAVCGSTITLGLDMGKDGGVTGLGMQVSACAIGQSSAAVLAGHIKGATADDIRATRDAITGWLAGEGTMPQWPRFEALAPALEHKGRHGALLLAWDGAVKALG